MSSNRVTPIELVCFDMAGTTVADGGAVEEAFLSALDAMGVRGDDPKRPAMLDYVRTTMGTSKITVFRALFGDDGLAAEANLATVTDKMIVIPGHGPVWRKVRHFGTFRQTGSVAPEISCAEECLINLRKFCRALRRFQLGRRCAFH